MGVTTSPVNYDPAAEAALIGAMIGLSDIVAEVAGTLASSDFWDRRAQAAFMTIVADWRAGRRTDEASLLSGVRAHGIEDVPWLTHALGQGGAAWRSHVEAIANARVGRDLISAIGDIKQLVETPGIPNAEVLDQLRARLTVVDVPTNHTPSDLWSLDEFIDQPDHESAAWVVPGLLRRGWRVVVVGTEGGGKSMLFRQVAVLAAQGIHPLGFQPIPPVRVLLIDLENPPDAIARACRNLRGRFSPEAYEKNRAWLWHRPGGINLRSRATRSELEAVLTATRPDLVALGPIYKSYRRTGAETDEEAVADVQATLDDLRTRHGFALLLEHHAPQESGGVRKLRPYGSSLWLRWPEIGIAMQPDPTAPKDHRRPTLERWRGDRMSNSWPDRLEQDDHWPWRGVWPDNRWRDES